MSSRGPHVWLTPHSAFHSQNRWRHKVLQLAQAEWSVASRASVCPLHRLFSDESFLQAQSHPCDPSLLPCGCVTASTFIHGNDPVATQTFSRKEEGWVRVETVWSPWQQSKLPPPPRDWSSDLDPNTLANHRANLGLPQPQYTPLPPPRHPRSPTTPPTLGPRIPAIL